LSREIRDGGGFETGPGRGDGALDGALDVAYGGSSLAAEGACAMVFNLEVHGQRYVGGRKERDSSKALCHVRDNIFTVCWGALLVGRWMVGIGKRETCSAMRRCRGSARTGQPLE
jgi:hypothetical protein